MRLEHLNLVVRDLVKTLAFYQVAFPHWRVRTSGKAEWYGVERNWLHFGDDYQYLTFNDDGVEDNRDLSGHQVGLAHFAFETRDVEAIIKRMSNAGFPPRLIGRENPFRKNAYFIDPDGYEVEFVEYSSDLPEERNNNE